MQNRFKDIPYCGVDRFLIVQAHPILDARNLDLLKHFIEERYAIHIKKDVLKQPYPWTDDLILREYKFTNVRREHDKQSKYLIDNVCLNPAIGYRSKVYNVFMFRAWNNWETMRDFGGPWKWHQIASPQLKEQVRPIYHQLLAQEPDRKWWSNAYNQGGTKYAWKFPAGDGFGRAKSEEAGRKFPDYEPDIPLRAFHIGPWLHDSKIFQSIKNAGSQEQVYNIITTLRGFSTFLAYQIFVDLTYIPQFQFSENEFTVAGPGCRKGLDLVFKDRDGMSYEDCLFWMREYLNAHMNFEHMFNDLPQEDRHMNVMSMENCFCELSKYIRTYDGKGRPKLKYKGQEG